MSGAEGLAVLGIIVNIMTLADLSARALSRVKEYSDKADALPESFREVESILPLVAGTLGRAKERAESEPCDESLKQLRPVFERCEKKMSQLKVIFDAALAREGASTLERGWKALKSMRKDEEVQQIAQGLHNFIALLAQHHIFATATSKEVAGLAEGMQVIALSQPVEAKPKTYFMVPVRWNDDFVGRTEILAALESKLCKGNYCRVALVGLGGMRKTSVALQYVQRHKASSDTSVFWIHASSSDRLKNACSEIAKKLNLPGCGKSGVDGLRVFKDWLESEESGLWLIVLDNVDDMEVLYESGHMRLAEYLPRSERCSILLTTRFGKVGNSFTARRDIINLSALSSEEAESLLTHRLGEEKPKSDQRRYVELANELERLPLSLVQAASCMFQNDVSISDYLELYRRSDASKIQLLSEGFEDHDVNTSIATTWVISFEYLSKHEAQAADLLSCMCMFSSQALPENLLPPGQDPVSFQKAIGTLKAYSFISVFENSSHPLLNPKPLFNLHRLVRLATRNWLKMNGVFDLWTAKAIKKAAIECMQTDKDLADSSSIFHSSPPIVLVPHINALIQEPVLLPAYNAAGLPDMFAAQDSGECAEDNIICAKCTAVVLTFLSNWASQSDSLALDEELIVARRNYALKMHIYGTEHAGTLASVRSLGVDYERSLNYEMADQFYREHLNLSRRMYGFADSRSARSMQNLLRFYEDRHSCAARSLIHLECERYTQQHEEHYLPEIDAWAAEYRYELKDFLQVELHQERAVSKILKNWKYKDRTPLATDFFEQMQNYIHTQDGTILRWIKRLASIYTRNEKWTKAEWAYRLALAFGEKTACDFKKDRRRTRAKLKSLTLREAVHEAKEQESLATQQWQSAVEHGLP